MGSSVSTEEVLENGANIVTEMRRRISSIESSVSLLQKHVMNLQISQVKNEEAIKTLDDYILSLRLMEEGRSSYSKKRFHTRSTYNF